MDETMDAVRLLIENVYKSGDINQATYEKIKKEIEKNGRKK